MLLGLILAKSLAAPRSSDIAGAYPGKIFFCAPLFPYRRGLSWRNFFLRPALPISPGLILAKSLAAPRSSHIAGAYPGKISCCAPLSPYRRGLSWQNFFLRPALPISPGLILTKSLATPPRSDIAGAYFNKISCYAPPSRYRRGLF